MSPFLAGALGALSLFLLARLVRGAFWLGRMRRFRRGGPLPVARLARRLGLRPEQTSLLSTELETLWREASALRQEARGVPSELAGLFSAETLDAAAVSAALDARLARLGALRAQAVASLGRLHATLDADQRARVVALLQRGPGGHGRCGHRAHA
jgi:uncharacterized membrane protein